MILLVGQYSTGKTTFIKYLLEQEFPGMRIGPEPTTDCFIIITKVNLKNIQLIIQINKLAGHNRRQGSHVVKLMSLLSALSKALIELLLMFSI